jgi:MFS family permease
MSNRPKCFHAWWVVTTAATGLFFSTGTIVVLSFGVFVKPLSQSFHVGRAAVSLAFTLHGLLSAACVPLTGRLIDSFGARRVILTGTTIFGLILLFSPFVGSSLASLYLFYAALGIVSGTTSPVPYGVVISHWFDRQRGLALGIMACGIGLGAIAMPLAAQRLIVLLGWRATYAVFGSTTLLLSLPVVAAFLAEHPRRKRTGPDGILPLHSIRPENYEGLSWHDTWHQATFWLLLCAFFLAGASLFACVLHLPALLTDRGVSAQGAAVTSSVIGAALLVGRVGAGYLLDRVFAPRLTMLLFGVSTVGIALLLAGRGGVKVALFAAFLVGVGMGAEVDIIAFLTSRYFGLRALGSAFGYGFGSYAFGGALGVLLMGTGFDLAHSYTLPLAGCILAMLLAAGLIIRLGPYRYAAGKSDEFPPAAEVYVGSRA